MTGKSKILCLTAIMLCSSKVYSYSNYQKLSTSFSTNIKGPALEAVARNYMAGQGVESVSHQATYNGGKNGLDGAFIKRDAQGRIKKIYVQEVKSGNAQLTLQKRTPQMSRQWITEDLQKSLKENRGLSLAQRKDMQQFMNMAQQNVNLNRFVDRVNIEDGRLKIQRTHIKRDLNYKNIPNSKRNINNVFDVTPSRTIADIPLLEKSTARLTPYERRVRDSVFDNLGTRMRKQGYSEYAITKTLNEIKTNPRVSTRGGGPNSIEAIAIRNEMNTRTVKKLGTTANAKFIKFVPVVMGLLDIAFDIKDLVDVYSEWKDGLINHQIFVIKTAGLVGGIAGGELMAMAGAKIGSFIAPGIGTIIGGLAGGILGYMLGDFLGTNLATSYYENTDDQLDEQLFLQQCQNAREYCSEALSV